MTAATPTCRAVPFLRAASSQVGMALAGCVPAGAARWRMGRLHGSVALAMIAFALASRTMARSPRRHGSRPEDRAVAIVAQAVWTMARSLCPDWPRAHWPSSPRC